MMESAPTSLAAENLRLQESLCIRDILALHLCSFDPGVLQSFRFNAYTIPRTAILPPLPPAIEQFIGPLHLRPGRGDAKPLQMRYSDFPKALGLGTSSQAPTSTCQASAGAGGTTAEGHMSSPELTSITNPQLLSIRVSGSGLTV